MRRKNRESVGARAQHAALAVVVAAGCAVSVSLAQPAGKAGPAPNVTARPADGSGGAEAGMDPRSTNGGLVNWENAHVHPLDLTPDHGTLLAVNTPDNRLEVFNVDAGGITRRGAIQVGLDPVSVRARTNTEIWVINHVSD